MAEVTDAELAAALKDAEDESGVDRRLAAATAAMTPEQRRKSEAAIRRLIEAARRSRESLESPHPGATELAEIGLADWGASLPADDESLVDVSVGMPVRWVEGQGWVERSR